ncbi:unnamed protein product [Taenia asiatica]|uniref:Fibronectin type-III domain-containing protein n=1 Tax=Taenia asiatica TaxID=60517 RepID=A0A0R3VVL6_TAEAS|nr:unnamed protein product [Taenia asiatica]
MVDTSAVKMAAIFYLILLATLVFAERNGDGPGTLSNKNIKLKAGLPEHFWWIFVGSRFVELGWDSTALVDLKPDEIKLTAFYYNESISYKYASVPFSYMRLTLNGLTPNTTYLVLLEAFQTGKEVFAHLSAVTTAAKGSGGHSLGFTLLSVISGLLLLSWQ